MTKNFTNFTFKTPVTGDFLVGYRQDGSSELKTTIKELIDLSDDSSLINFLSYLKTNSISLSSQFISLSSVEFKGKVKTENTSITATNSFITISVNNQDKYIRLFDVI